MIGHARARAGTDVEPDVEALGAHHGAQQFLGFLGQGEEFELLLGVQLADVRHLAVGHGHQVTRRVGIAVHDQETALAPQDDQVRPVIGRTRRFQKEVRQGTLQGEVLDAPRRPERGEVFLGKAHEGSARSGCRPAGVMDR